MHIYMHIYAYIHTAQSKFENFTCELLSLINKLEKLIYNQPKEMVQNKMDKYLV